MKGQVMGIWGENNGRAHRDLRDHQTFQNEGLLTPVNKAWKDGAPWLIHRPPRR